MDSALFSRVIKYATPRVEVSGKHKIRFSKSNLTPNFRELNDKVIELENTWFSKRPENSQKDLFGRITESEKAIVENIFHGFLDKKMKMAEFGCGAYGLLNNFLIPGGYKSNYTQYDINPFFVKNNRKFTLFNFFKWPDVRVGNIYDMPIKDESVDVILGLSAWDSISTPEKTIPEIKRCLQSGGYFIHFQDIIPADYPILISEIRKRESKGLPPKFDCEYITRTKIPAEGIYLREELLVGIESIDSGKMENTSRYLTQNLADVCSKGGMEICLNAEITETAIQKRRSYGHLTKREMVEPIDRKNVIESSPCDIRNYYMDPSIKKGYFKTISKMDVIVAKKI